MDHLILRGSEKLGVNNYTFQTRSQHFPSPVEIHLNSADVSQLTTAKAKAMENQ